MRYSVARLLKAAVRRPLPLGRRAAAVRHNPPSTRPMLEFLEYRDMPGDVAGGYILTGLAGLLPPRDPLASAEAALASAGLAVGTADLSIAPAASRPDDSHVSAFTAPPKEARQAASVASPSGSGAVTGVTAGQGPAAWGVSPPSSSAPTPWGGDPSRKTP